MTTDATLDGLAQAVAALTDREAVLAAELLGGIALVTEEEGGQPRLAAAWRAFGLVLMDEVERKQAVLAALEADGGDVGADGGG